MANTTLDVALFRKHSGHLSVRLWIMWSALNFGHELLFRGRSTEALPVDTLPSARRFTRIHFCKRPRQRERRGVIVGAGFRRSLQKRHGFCGLVLCQERVAEYKRGSQI